MTATPAGGIWVGCPRIHAPPASAAGVRPFSWLPHFFPPCTLCEQCLHDCVDPQRMPSTELSHYMLNQIVMARSSSTRYMGTTSTPCWRGRLPSPPFWPLPPPALHPSPCRLQNGDHITCIFLDAGALRPEEAGTGSRIKKCEGSLQATGGLVLSEHACCHCPFLQLGGRPTLWRVHDGLTGRLRLEGLLGSLRRNTKQTSTVPGSCRESAP